MGGVGGAVWCGVIWGGLKRSTLRWLVTLSDVGFSAHVLSLATEGLAQVSTEDTTGPLMVKLSRRCR